MAETRRQLRTVKREEEVYADRIEDLLREKRLEGKNESWVAEKLQISKAALSSYKKGNAVPDLITARRMAKVFGVPIDYVAGLTESKISDMDDRAASNRYGLSENTLGVLVLLAKHRNEHIRHGGSDYKFSEALDGINWIFDTESPVEFFSMIARYAKRYYDHPISFSKEAENQAALGGTPDNPVSENTVIFSEEQQEAMQLVMIQTYLLTERIKRERGADDGNGSKER